MPCDANATRCPSWPRHNPWRSPSSSAGLQDRDERGEQGQDAAMKRIADRRRWWIVLLGVLIAYLVLAYVILPALWSHHEHEPGLASLPMVTRTASGIPGDALNVGLVGSKQDVLRAMHAAGWFPADPITLRTSIE